MSFMIRIISLLLLLLVVATNAWVTTTTTVCGRSRCLSSSRLFSTTEENSVATSTETATDKDDDEWEYEEMDELTEQDFIGSEWLIGTNWDSSPNQIKETWVRLLVNERGQNVAVWGDERREGKWSVDVASQFFCISKDSWGGWFGKKIWAGTIDDYYYLQGTVRGWSPISPASVLGQWQAKRLGVDKDEAGTAPWFSEEYMEEQELLRQENLQKQKELQEDEGIFGVFDKKEEKKEESS